jgi:predicted membrane-bound mannosyltransferase
LLFILALATLLRAWNLGAWSMWEDEEGSIFHAQRPYQGFPGFFPVFFVALNQLLGVTGLSVGAARVLPAVMGLLSIVFTYTCFRRFVTPRTALLAAFLLAVNLGHLFWSQSIRYYTTALVFQVLSMYWFLDGFESKKVGALLLSNLALVLALLTHFSALLLAPVFIGYLALMIWSRESEAGYRPRYYLLFGVPLAVVLALFTLRMAELRSLFDGMGAAIASARSPAHVGLTVVAYFGVPLVTLGLLAPWLARELPRRTLLFLLTAAVIPVLELLVIAQLNTVNVTWYYALVAMVPFALLAAASLTSLWERGRRAAAGTLGAGSLVYYVALLVGYFTAMHGDRPRWEEAAAYLRQTAGVRVGSGQNPKVFASVPGVVAYYLGADPRRPESYRLVEPVPRHPSDRAGAGERWYVMEAKLITPEYRAWFAEHCTLRAQFETFTGPINRSVLVYHCTDGSTAHSARQAAQTDRGLRTADSSH